MGAPVTDLPHLLSLCTRKTGDAAVMAQLLEGIPSRRRNWDPLQRGDDCSWRGSIKTPHRVGQNPSLGMFGTHDPSSLGPDLL